MNRFRESNYVIYNYEISNTFSLNYFDHIDAELSGKYFCSILLRTVMYKLHVSVQYIMVMRPVSHMDIHCSHIPQENYACSWFRSNFPSIT